VLQSVPVVNDQVWLHTSLSRPKRGRPGRLPSYEDVCRVHRLFVGDDRLTLQAFVPMEQHVNLANVLHLYTPLEAEGFVFPDFRLEVAPGVWDLK
jgi:hypothetical protein